MALTAVAMFAIAGCSSGYNLDKDASLKTDWGTVLQYKVDSNWKDTSLDSNSSYSASASYDSEEGDDFIIVHVDNTRGSSYGTPDIQTYEEWEDGLKKTFSRSAQDQVDWYKEMLSEDRSVDEFPDYSNCSLDEQDPITVGDTEFRTFKLKYTVTYSDEAYKKAKENQTDLQQSHEGENYYAVLKDGEHDMEVTATSYGLLKDFMNTMEISW